MLKKFKIAADVDVVAPSKFATFVVVCPCSLNIDTHTACIMHILYIFMCVYIHIYVYIYICMNIGNCFFLINIQHALSMIIRSGTPVVVVVDFLLLVQPQ